MSSNDDGFLDTNVFLHAFTHDRLSEECRRFLAALEQGQLRARLEPLVLHEMSYSLRHYAKQMTRPQMAHYLLSILDWPGVEGDKDLMREVVNRWGKTADLGFVDAYLATLALREGRPVFTKNVRDLTGQGVTVPDPLPTGTKT